jgi:tripeptidyl-peptidase-1
MGSPRPLEFEPALVLIETWIAMVMITGLLALVGGATAIATASANLMESLRQVPDGWKSVGKPASDQRIHLRIAMNSPSESLFEQTLYDMSTPSHANYGNHLKRDELKAMLRPHPEATESVLSWLSKAGIASESIVDDGDWINFIASIGQAEALLDTTFDVYRNAVGKTDKVRTLHYSVPEHLHQHIDSTCCQSLICRSFS